MQSLCLPAPNPDDGSFCASSCAEYPCPLGYDCTKIDLTAEYDTARVCIPVDGSCSCRPRWASRGYETDCVDRSTTSTCMAFRTCTAEGLSPCLTPLPKPERCNWRDDDCDGTIDEGDLCEVGSCLDGTCN